MRIKHRRIQYSIMGLFFALLFILSGIMVFGITYMQRHQREALLNQAADNHANILSSYIWYMENTFDNTENALYSYLYDNPNVNVLGRNADDVSRYRAKQSVLNSLEQIVQMNDVIQSAWIYSPRGNNAEFLARNGYIGLNYTELCHIQDEILQIISRKESTNMGSDKWTLMHVDGSGYLLWIMSVEDIYCGAWTSLDRLYQCFQSINPLHSDSSLLFYSPDGEVLIPSDDAYHLDAFPKNTWIVEDGQLKTFQSSRRTEIVFSIVTGQETALGGIKSSFDYAWFAACLIAFSLFAFIVFQILVYKPFRSLISRLEEISHGDLEQRITDTSGFLDTQRLSTTINHFLDEISALKIAVYESQLHSRDVECQYLQIRLKTHFYLNCLNIIHTMARVKNTALIQELTVCLANYLRFIEEDTRKFVPLEKELEHVRNYAHIQELRFPNVFQYFEDVPTELYDVSIPPLVLQTFVENSVKYAIRYDQKNWIRLSARMIDDGDALGIAYEITDNGTGFSQDVLSSLSSAQQTFDSTKSHGIGISNVISRLAMLYDGKARISFENSEQGGAKVSMWLPLMVKDEEE